MIKSFSILFLIFLHHQIHASPGDAGIRYEPMMKLISNRAQILKTFPFKDIPIREGEIVEKYLCPAESDEDVAEIEEASKYNYKLKYCLFKKNFDENEDRICKKEVNFVFNKIMNLENDGICGSTPYQTMHTFSYHDCDDLSILNYLKSLKHEPVSQSYEIDSALIRQHEICYDLAEKSVIWTEHYIRTPQLFQNPYFKNQKSLPATEISTKSYFMDEDLFLILKNQYELEKQKNVSEPGAFIMVPQPLVPPDHYALPIMKKSTNHYINMAPLWEKLVPLVTAIDQGIKQAQLNLESNDPNSYDPFIIQTRVKMPQGVEINSNTWFNLQLFRGNIWYKLIFQEKMESSVMIIIHNTPGNPPSTGHGCIIGEENECDFKMWTEDENLREQITSDDTKYAFCCAITAPDLNGIFPNDYDIYNYYLDIDYLISSRKL